MSERAMRERAAGRVTERSRRYARALVDFEPGLVIPFLALGLMIPQLLGAALVVAILFWVVRWVAWGRLTVPTAGDPPIAVLVLMFPVTQWATALPDVTRQQVLWLASGIALYYVIVNWVRTAARERMFVLGVVAAGLTAALVAPVAVTWVTDIKFTFIPETFYEQLPLFTSTPINPNVLAGVLVLALPVPLALLMFGGLAGVGRSGRVERAAATAAVAGMAAIIVLTKSRGALLAGAVAALGLVLLRWRRGWIAIVLAVLLAGLAAWAIGFGQVLEMLNSTGSTVGGPGRLEIWTRGIYLVEDFPFTGIGMGTFKEVTNGLYPFFLLGPDADIPHAHNLFLQVAVDLGIPGLVAWLSLLILVIAAAWRVYWRGRREGSTWAMGLGAGLLGSQVALVVHGMLDAAVWGAHSGLVVWGLWGLCMASSSLRQGRGGDLPGLRHPGRRKPGWRPKPDRSVGLRVHRVRVGVQLEPAHEVPAAHDADQPARVDDGQLAHVAARELIQRISRVLARRHDG